MKTFLRSVIGILLPALPLLFTTIVKGQNHSSDRINNRLYSDSTAKSTIDSIYNLLKGGASFNDLATTYSQDESSYKRGGELDYMYADNYVIEYRDTLLKLAKNGLSMPFKTSFGYHIVQLIDKKENLYLSKHILIQVDGKRKSSSIASRILSEVDLSHIEKVDSSFGYDSFYKKCVYANDIPILSSDNVY